MQGAGAPQVVLGAGAPQVVLGAEAPKVVKASRADITKRPPGYLIPLQSFCVHHDGDV